MTTETNANPAVVTEDALLKSLQDLEARAAGQAPAQEEPAPAQVETPTITSAAAALEANETLKKAIDVSPTLKEMVTGIGAHIDSVLAPLAKSIENSAARDQAIAGTFEKMLKSLTDLGDKIEAIGKEPAAPANARPVTTDPEQVLNKSGAEQPKAGEPDEAARAKQARQLVIGGLENMVKSLPAGSAEQGRYTHALINFEGSGEIDPAMLAAAHAAVKNPPQPVH